MGYTEVARDRGWALRRILPAAFLLGFCAAVSAQQGQDALIQKRDAKLKAAFLAKAAWITDYDKAREEAKKSGRLIFAYFTRSYAN